MPAPMNRPIKKPVIIKMRLPLLATAASACLPTNLPTMTLSTVLYSCWQRLPKKTGTAKLTMRFQMEPVVISVLRLMAATPHRLLM